MISIVKTAKNRFKIRASSEEERPLLHYVKRQLTVKNPNVRFMQWGEDEISALSPTFTFLPGLTLDIVRELRSYDPSVEIDISEVRSEVLPLSVRADPSSVENSDFVYYDFQKESIRLGLLFGRGIFELATSAGKSLIIYGLIKNIWEQIGKKKVLVLVPSIQLVSQMSKEFVEYGCDPSEICRFTASIDRKIGSQNIIVANRQWLEKHEGELPKIDVLMVDEAQQLGSGNHVSKFVRKLPTFMKFGFTGTLPEWPPSRWNVIGLLGTILKVKRAKELQDAGYIAGCDIVGIMFSHRDKPRIPDDIMEALRLAELDGREELIGLAKQEVAKARFPAEWRHIEDSDWTNRFMVRMMNAYPGNTILLYDHIAHGHRLREILEEVEKTKRIFLIDGSTPLDEREDVRDAMEEHGNCFLFGNTKCVGVGVSIKNIDNIGFGFSSGTAATKIIQAIGRGLRLREGKTKVRITDFYHDFRYSKEHFGKRLELYNKHYGITRAGVVYRAVEVPLPGDRVDRF